MTKEFTVKKSQNELRTGDYNPNTYNPGSYNPSPGAGPPLEMPAASLVNNPQSTPPPRQGRTQGLTAGIPLYLGTGQISPSFEIAPDWEPVYRDGCKGPADLLWAGERAYIACDLSNWREDTHSLVSARPGGSGGLIRGSWWDLAEGAMAVREGQGLTVYLSFVGTARPIMAAAGLPLGYRFFATVAAGPDKHWPMGAGTAKILHLAWHALPVPYRINGKVRHVLYDHDVRAAIAVGIN